MIIKKLAAVLTALSLAAVMTACNNANSTKEGGTITTADVSDLTTVTESSEVTELDTTAAEAAVQSLIDREGKEVEIPDSIETIVSTAPSVTEILDGLGLMDKIIAADLYSADVEGISADICTIDFSNLNIEELVALSPDLIIVSGMSQTGADDPYAALKEAGANVVYIPTSSSIEGIKLDIEFLAAYLKAEDKGAELIADIDSTVAEISEKADTITEKKKVYFEIGAAPYLYTCGNGTFIDEVITLVGAENIYGGEAGWISNSEETVIAADPDVIITNVMYEGYDFNEIKSRPGWENIAAVKDGAVYQVDANATSRPSQHITEGIRQVAEAIYPEVYGE